MDREHKGRRDNEGAARYRLSKKTGVPESYLFRLAYKRREMRDVAGEVYRRLKHGYDELCLGIETAADAMERQRVQIEVENAFSQSRPTMVADVAKPARGAEEAKKEPVK